MDNLSCKHRWANKGSVPWHLKESRSLCKNAVNDSAIASSISWWQGWHLFYCISPMSLQDGKKKYKQTTIGYWFCMFITNSLSRRTLLQINLTQIHFDTQTLWHTKAFTRKRFYRQRLLHTDATLLHTDAFTHKRFYTQTLLHIDTEAFTHRRFYIQTLLHTNAFPHKRFYTQTLLYTNTFTHRRFHRDFYTETLTKRGTTKGAQT